jgi:hypothetical protein
VPVCLDSRARIMRGAVGDPRRVWQVSSRTRRK